MPAKLCALLAQFRKVGTNATLVPWEFNWFNTDVHQPAEFMAASNAVATRRPSLRRYAEGLFATAAMIWTTALELDLNAVMSGITTILNRGSTACAAARSTCSGLSLPVASLTDMTSNSNPVMPRAIAERTSASILSSCHVELVLGLAPKGLWRRNPPCATHLSDSPFLVRYWVL